MPDSTDFWGSTGGNLTISVNNGSLAESRVTDMATRIVAAWYQMGQDASFRLQIIPLSTNVNAGRIPRTGYWNAT